MKANGSVKLGTAIEIRRGSGDFGVEFLGAFTAVLLLGAVIYGKLWWDGSGMSWRFTKWYFGLFAVGALITGICTSLAI